MTPWPTRFTLERHHQVPRRALKGPAVFRFLSNLFAVHLRRGLKLAPRQAEVHCLSCARREAARLPVRSTRTERARARGRRPLPSDCASCAPPPVRRPRRRQQLALGLALGACAALLLVVVLPPRQVPREPHDAPPVALAAVELPDAGMALEDVATVDVNVDGGQPFWMGNRPVPLRIPKREDAPETWKRAPCGKNQREVNGLCFVELREAPQRDGTCANGLPHEGRCLAPVTAAKRIPSSIER